MPFLVAKGVPVGDPQTSGTAFVKMPPCLANDIRVILLGADQSPAGVSIDGFTLGPQVTSQATRIIQVWWKRAAADGEADPTITHSFTTDNIWIPLLIRGCPTSGDPIDTSASDDTESTTTHNAPTVTPGTTNCGILTLDCSTSDNQYTAISNANTSPRLVENSTGSIANPGQRLGVGWGHMAAASATGATAFTINVSTTSSTMTVAFKDDGAASSRTGPTLRDSILSSEPASASTITLPTNQQNDLLIAMIAGSVQATTFAATLSGFTKIQDCPVVSAHGRPLSILTKRAGASESNPTITHTFGGADDWAVIIASIPGDLESFLWEHGATADPVNAAQNIEVGSDATVLGLAASELNLTYTAVDYDVATNETEAIEGGPASCKICLYTADMSAADWIGRPSWDLSTSSDLNWVTLAVTEGIPPVTGTASPSQANQTSTASGTVTNPAPPPGPGGNRIGGTGAIRKPPR